MAVQKKGKKKSPGGLSGYWTLSSVFKKALLAIWQKTIFILIHSFLYTLFGKLLLPLPLVKNNNNTKLTHCLIDLACLAQLACYICELHFNCRWGRLISGAKGTNSLPFFLVVDLSMEIKWTCSLFNCWIFSTTIDWAIRGKQPLKWTCSMWTRVTSIHHLLANKAKKNKEAKIISLWSNGAAAKEYFRFWSGAQNQEHWGGIASMRSKSSATAAVAKTMTAACGEAINHNYLYWS